MSESLFVAAPNEYRLFSPPNDGISKLQFSPSANSKLLIASSWDGTVRLYDVGTSTQNIERASYSHSQAVLTCTFLEGDKISSGGLDRMVKLYNPETTAELLLGAHDDPVRCMEYSWEHRVLVTGGWDGQMKLWDPRMMCCTHTQPQGERVYALDLSKWRAVVGTADRRVIIWDIRNLSTPEQRRESSLKFQTRSIRTFPSASGFVMSSIEGRVAVEYFDPGAEAQKMKYAFKCHRVREADQELIYPVNSIAFHPDYNSFATGGSDALVNVWDPFNKKRLCQFHKYPTSISSLAFNWDGSLLAIASSYQYEQSQEPNPIPDNSIFIRKVTDQETKPKH